jgi:8-oxo-dGTP pyrophosphatase MutT (NUDIX family)
MNKTQLPPHRLTEKVKLLHKVALVYQDKVLVLKRAENSASRPGKWDLPGGNSEWPTAASEIQKNLHQQDIAREIKEETGIKINADAFLEDNLVFFATFFEPDQQVYSINCGWGVPLKLDSEPKVKISHEHQAYKWISLDELTNLDFGPADRDFEQLTIKRAMALAKND